MQKYTVYDLLDKLYVVNRLTLTRLHEYLGIDYEQLRKLLNCLKMMGLTIKPDIMPSKLGLRPVFVVMETKFRICLEKITRSSIEIPFVKALSYIPPNKVFISLQVPRKSKLSQSVEASENPYLNNIKIYVFDYVVRSKPDTKLIKTLMEQGPLAIIKENIYEYLLNSRLPIDINYLRDESRFDFLDLKLLSELTHDPFIPLTKLSRKLNIRMKRLESHIKHAEQLLYGYRISKIQLATPPKQAGILIIECRKYENICEFLIRHPMVISCVGDFKNRMFMIMVRDLGINLGLVIHILNEFLSTIGCEVIGFEMYFLDHHLCTVLTIPSAPTELAYVPHIRGWKKDVKLNELLLKVLNIIHC